MAVLSEECIVLDRVAKSTNLFSKIISAVIHVVKGLRNILIKTSIIVELNRARVDIGVLCFPYVLSGLEGLELLAGKLDRLRADNQVSGLETFLGVRLEKGQDGNTTNAPLADGLSALTNSHSHTSKALFNQNSCSETSSRTKAAIELARVTRAALISEVVRHRCKASLVSTAGLTSLELLLNEVRNKFLGLDRGKLDLSLSLTVDKKLLLEEIG